MIPHYRQPFNASFTPDNYRALLARLEQECGTPIPFRISETACFLETTLVEKMTRYGRELIRQLMENPVYQSESAATVPPAFNVPNETERPLFIQVDFGLDEQQEPKLVEIQAFPSLYAFQPVLAEGYQSVFGLEESLSLFPDGLTADRYHALLREAIVGNHAPENVVLLEIEPHKQKTLPDFRLTERFYGIATVCISEVKKEGKRLLYHKDGRWMPIERIYNRAIAEELPKAAIQPAFDFRDDLDVEWAGHPNWYYRISKFSLPYLRHIAVPETHFLSHLSSIPDDLENWVLKPLFSFAGQGVVVGPTPEDIAAVSDRSQYILQRRVNFSPVIETPHGPTKVEVRVMFVWADELCPVILLLRMGRGKQMGVDFNRALAWVGASAAFLAG